MTIGKHVPDRIKKKIVEMRKEGFDNATIGERFGLNKITVSQVYNREIRKEEK